MKCSFKHTPYSKNLKVAADARILKVYALSQSLISVLSELIGEVQEVQPVNNISTAADLLKQGAGEVTIHPSYLLSPLQSHYYV